MVHYDVQTDAAFAALADPARRAIVSRLAAGDLTVSQIAAPFETTLQAVRKHLAVLEGAGLVTSTKSGRERRCRLRVEPLKQAVGWLQSRAALWEGRLDALAAVVEEEGRSS